MYELGLLIEQDKANQEQSKLFIKLYDDILKNFDFKSYHEVLKSTLKLGNSLSDYMYIHLHMEISRTLEEIVRVRRFSQSETLKDISEYIYDYIRNYYTKKYQSLSDHDKDQEVINLVSNFFKNKNVDLKDLSDVVFVKLYEVYSKVYTNDKFADFFIYQSLDGRIEYIVYSSITREQAIQMIMKEIQRIYSSVTLKVLKLYIKKIKSFIINSVKTIKGPVWTKIKEFVIDTKQNVESFVEKDKKNLIIVGLVVVVILLGIAKLVPYVKKLIMKIIGFFKHGYSKFMNVISRIFGRKKSEEHKDDDFDIDDYKSLTLFEMYVKNRYVRKLIEMKLERINVLLDMYYEMF